MRITLMQIEAFYWTARLGGVHAASRHLHLTQPAVSARIKEMESLLSVKLFDRSKQRMSLTADGHTALRHAELVLNNSTQLEQFAAQQKQHRRLRLGADECSAMVGLTAVISEIKAHFPEITLEITIDVGAALNRKLNDHELDIALLTNPATREDVTDVFLGWMTFQWVAARHLEIADGPFLPQQARQYSIVTQSAVDTVFGGGPLVAGKRLGEPRFSFQQLAGVYCQDGIGGACHWHIAGATDSRHVGGGHAEDITVRPGDSCGKVLPFLFD